MMLIRCPNCDSTHEVPASLMSDKPRKLRCAVCRTIFEAKASDSDSSLAKNEPSPILSGSGMGLPSKPASESAITSPDGEDPLIGSEEDMAAAMAEAGGDTTMSVDDIDSLFDEPLPGPPTEVSPATDLFAEALSTEVTPGKPDSESAGLEAGQGAAIAAGMAAVAAGAAAQSPDPEPVIRKRANPHGRGRKDASPGRLRNAIGLVAATGIGTLVALAIFRHETVRLIPSIAPAFEMLGLEVNSTGLEIKSVRSHILREDFRDTLEVTGEIVNITRARQGVPLLRLSLHAADGTQLYVWTGNADNAELGAGEKTLFRRRLASPPKDAEQVMVRFVARDDIVASIR